MNDSSINHIKRVQLFNEELNTRIICAGPSTTCSQKVHNIVAGITSASRQSSYALVLDSDIELHCYAIADLVQQVKEKRAFMGTGTLNHMCIQFSLSKLISNLCYRMANCSHSLDILISVLLLICSNIMGELSYIAIFTSYCVYVKYLWRIC